MTVADDSCALLSSLDGSTAPLGTLGRWLCDESDFIFVGDASDPPSVDDLGFPRDWPAVFKSSTVLKALSKGSCIQSRNRL